jgi:general secretion pathway protein J
VSPRHDAGAAGFTLIELLIALTLVGLLATLAFGGIRLAARAWERADTRSADAADRWTVENVLRDAITAAYPAFRSADLYDRSIAFDGEPNSLAVLAPLPQAIAAGVLAQMRFYLAGDGPSKTLMLGWRLDLPSADPEGVLPESRVVLLDRVHRIGFAYFGADEADETALWQERWSDRTALPLLVRFHLERSDPALPAWPDLIAEPRGMINTACIFDPLTAQCRRRQ